MEQYAQMEKSKQTRLLQALLNEYEAAKAMGLKLNMSRGIPCMEQLELSRPMLDVLSADSSTLGEGGMEYANYGLVQGIPEMRRLMAELMGLEATDVFIGGVSSLNLMHDCLSFAYVHGVPGSEKPWGKQESIKILCPVPGYDRHFSATVHFGYEMIPVPMLETGPDMDLVERLVAEDASIKGMWNVPKYSNPTGVTYSDETVRRIAGLKPAARDFRIFWDNAYLVHDLYPDRPDLLLPILPELKKHGNEDMLLMFASTSKITFPGAGIAALGCSPVNMQWFAGHTALQTIGSDKLNQLRHARFLRSGAAVRTHMAKHAELLRPRFDTVHGILTREVAPLGIARWYKPNGGYFIALHVLPGCAKRIVELCAVAGVTLTPAGAGFPHDCNPEDDTIRIAPTSPGLDDLTLATELLSLCVRIASLEKFLAA